MLGLESVTEQLRQLSKTLNKTTNLNSFLLALVQVTRNLYYAILKSIKLSLLKLKTGHCKDL